MEKIEDLFVGLEFDEKEHRYYKDGEEYISVNKFIERFTTPFDTLKIAGYSAKKEGVSVEEILKRWKNKVDAGSLFHETAHMYYLDYSVTGDVENAYALTPVENIYEFFKECIIDTLEIASAERRIFCDKIKIAGTPDIVAKNPKTGKYIIIDYKTNNDLKKSYKKTLKEPFNDAETNLNKYKIQLSMYAHMLEEKGLAVEDLWIIHSRPDGWELIKLGLDYLYKLKTYFNNNSTWLEEHL